MERSIVTEPSPAPAAAPEPAGAPIPFPEFVALVAALIALGAIGIDAMLPALPAIGRSLDVADPNARQYVVSTFLAGFGVAQLIHGPLADRFGRRTVLLVAVALYVVANAAAAVSGSFALLLAARVTAGSAIAATRVATVALVRDCYQGRAMARVMSIVFMVFMAVPVLAPAFGQLVLAVGSWRLIFWAIAALAAALLAWFGLRMPETLRPENRRPIHPAHIWSGWRRTAGDRQSLGYTLAATALMGGLYGYLNSVQQIMFDHFGRPGLLAGLFAGTAGAMAAANLTNARLVMRLGTRLISHGAVTMLVVVAVSHLLVIRAGYETLTSFALLQGLTLACFGLANANFSSMAMERMGAIAGTASSVQGFTSVTGGTVIGALIGQAFDGTPAPMVTGFATLGAMSLLLVAVTERGRLYRRA
jgi:MFS transporter, DHA1 family, multidrug resistance protein